MSKFHKRHIPWNKGKKLSKQSKELFNLSNGLTLCQKCHDKTW